MIRQGYDDQGRFSDEVRSRFTAGEGRPLFVCDWERVLMIHFEVEPAALQPVVPFELDLHHGCAYVSLVAFTMTRLRMGPLPLPGVPLRFLNVRTYVRCGEPGIYFLTEWLSNRLSTWTEPWLFGLPYCKGDLRYDHAHESGRLAGSVTARRATGRIAYRCDNCPGEGFVPCERGSLGEFLMERYTAFTTRFGRKRLFRVWHEPWQQRGVEVTMQDTSLLSVTGDWIGRARYVGANYSPGVTDTWIGRPRRARASRA